MVYMDGGKSPGGDGGAKQMEQDHRIAAPGKADAERVRRRRAGRDEGRDGFLQPGGDFGGSHGGALLAAPGVS